MSANELIYPIFLEVCKYADEDIFWKYVFEDLAYGRSPYGTYITKNFMCCNYKGKEFSYKIEVTKQPEVLPINRKRNFRVAPKEMDTTDVHGSIASPSLCQAILSPPFR